MTLPITWFTSSLELATWPDLAQGKVLLAPVRVGMDRRTGKMLVGWSHVLQSMELIFATRFHERILRRYVGSFVPHLLGESAVARIILRFFWAIASAIDLWEPDYAIKRVIIPPTITADQVRLGNWAFNVQGVYMPRGQLGDFTPDDRRGAAFVGRGSDLWESVQ